MGFTFILWVVYNVSQYMHYHPGGVSRIMEGAGKDCTKLFNKYHKWVNADSMLAGCLLGYIADDRISQIAEDETEPSNEKEVGAAAAGTAAADLQDKALAMLKSDAV